MQLAMARREDPSPNPPTTPLRDEPRPVVSPVQALQPQAQPSNQNNQPCYGQNPPHEPTHYQQEPQVFSQQLPQAQYLPQYA